MPLGSPADRQTTLQDMSQSSATFNALRLLNAVFPAEITLAILDLAGFWVRHAAAARHDAVVHGLAARDGRWPSDPYVALTLARTAKLRAIEFRSTAHYPLAVAAGPDRAWLAMEVLRGDDGADVGEGADGSPNGFEINW